MWLTRQPGNQRALMRNSDQLKSFYLCRSNPYEGQRRSKDRCEWCLGA